MLVKLVHAEGRDLRKRGLVADMPVAKDDDVVAERDRAAMMADHDRRPATGTQFQRLDDGSFRQTIHGVGGLVQNEDSRIAHKCPCQRDPLPLSGRQAGAPIADEGFVSMGQRFDELMRLRKPGGMLGLRG